MIPTGIRASAAMIATIAVVTSASAAAQDSPPPEAPDGASAASIRVTVERDPPPAFAPPPVDPDELRARTDAELELELGARRGRLHLGVEVGMFGIVEENAIPMTSSDGAGWMLGVEAWHGITRPLEIVFAVSFADVATRVDNFSAAGAGCYESGSAQRLALSAGVRVRPWLRTTFHLGGGVHAGVLRATVAEADRCDGETWAALVGLEADVGIAFGPENIFTLGGRILVDRLSVDDDLSVMAVSPPEPGMPASVALLLYLALSFPGR